jgi:MFS family permease
VSRNALLLGSLAVGVSFLSTAFAIGSSQYAFGLFVPAIEGAFGWTRTHISASLSLTAVGGLVAPLLGRWMDRRGVRQVLTVSVLLMATSFLLRPFMTELWHWYALSTLQFIGFSGASVLAAGKLVGTWFAHARGRAMGIATMGNNFGGLVLPPLVAVVLTAHGWQGAYLALGAIGVAIAVLAVGLVRDAPSAPEVSRDARLAARSAPGAGTAVAGPDGWTAGEALRSRTFYAIVVAVGLGFFTYSAVLPHVTAHLINRGVSAGEASAALSLLAICGMGSKLGFGFLAERFGARRTMMWNLVGQACFTLAMILALDSWLVWAGDLRHAALRQHHGPDQHGEHRLVRARSAGRGILLRPHGRLRHRARDRGRAFPDGSRGARGGQDPTGGACALTVPIQGTRARARAACTVNGAQRASCRRASARAKFSCCIASTLPPRSGCASAASLRKRVSTAPRVHGWPASNPRTPRHGSGWGLRRAGSSAEREKGLRNQSLTSFAPEDHRDGRRTVNPAPT